MLRFIWAQLRGRPRRTLALLAGVLVATTGFTLLSAAATVQQVRVDGAIEANFRPAYDILVRPRGSRTALEDERGVVRPNYLSGLFGGITTAQLDDVRATGHVELAAPIAMLGYTKVQVVQTVDLTDRVDPAARTQLFRLAPTWIADRGLTLIDDAPKYVYVTRNPVHPEKFVVGVQPAGRLYADGTVMPHRMTDCLTNLEVREDGSKVELCLRSGRMGGGSGTTATERTHMVVRRILPDGRFAEPDPFGDRETDRLVVQVSWSVMVLAAAVDPAAEASLVGLDDATVAGRYLRESDRPAPRPDSNPLPELDDSHTGVPVLAADRPYVDEQVRVSVDRLDAAAASSVADTPQTEWAPSLAAAGGTPSGPPFRSSGSPRLDVDGTSSFEASLDLLYQSGPTGYTAGAGGVLRPREVPLEPDVWQIPTAGSGQTFADPPPPFAFDTGFRPVTRAGGNATGAGGFTVIEPVGTFDPGRLRGFSPLSRLPLETYRAPEASGADAASRRALGGKPLQPNSNPAGYLATPPLILTTLAAVGTLPVRQDAPLSAIRVRVAGVTGFNQDSLDRVRSVALRIADRTGLDVDITIGASPAPQTVVLPAGEAGRPELRLTEGWSRKGAAVVIVEAADRKSLALFGLILLVCALFLGNAVAAAVRDRRRELAVLACLGWPARRLAGVILGEVALVGLVAGGLAAGVALPLSGVAGVPVSGRHALLALPVGLGVALLAAVPPALSAARARPGAAVHPAVLGVRRSRPRRTVLGLAMANLWRVPGRTALGVVALAVGVGALTVLVALSTAFQDDVIGTLLGDEIAARVRTVDVLAAAAAVGLGVLVVADVLYINLRERSAELAALWASGWSNSALLRLAGYEGLGIGLLGAVVGAGAGLLGIGWYAGRLDQGVLWLAAGIAAAAVAVAGLVALVPAFLLRRFPLSTLLAEE